MPPPREVALPGGRVLTYDDVGDPAGRPVVYLHGTPDSRLARHPDDGLAARAGVRLLAVDRPGYGGTTARQGGGGTGGSGETSAASDAGGPAGFGGDLGGLLDALAIPSAALLAWSCGALDAVAAAVSPGLRDRLSGVWLVAGLVPRDAYVDPAIRAAGANRLGLLELAESLSAAELAEVVAPLLAPYPCDLALARAHQRDQRTPADQRALEAIPGAAEQMASALVEAVRNGLTGVDADLRAQVRPVGELLRRVTVPVHLLYGSADVVTPPAFGSWYARHLPQAGLEIVDDAGHHLPFTHWPYILDCLTSA